MQRALAFVGGFDPRIRQHVRCREFFSACGDTDSVNGFDDRGFLRLARFRGVEFPNLAAAVEHYLFGEGAAAVHDGNRSGSRRRICDGNRHAALIDDDRFVDCDRLVDVDLFPDIDLLPDIFAVTASISAAAPKRPECRQCGVCETPGAAAGAAMAKAIAAAANRRKVFLVFGVMTRVPSRLGHDRYGPVFVWGKGAQSLNDPALRSRNRAIARSRSACRAVPNRHGGEKHLR